MLLATDANESNVAAFNFNDNEQKGFSCTFRVARSIDRSSDRSCAIDASNAAVIYIDSERKFNTDDHQFQYTSLYPTIGYNALNIARTNIGPQCNIVIN